MPLTNYVVESMGFREVIPHGAFSASFMSVTVFEARGVAISNSFAEAREGRVAGADYRIAIAKEVNHGCRALTGDNFVDSEPGWCQQVKSNGPFLLIGVGPTAFLESAAGHVQRHEDGSVTTYDSFPHARDVLRGLEQRVLPPVVASATVALNKPDNYVCLRHLQRASYARCPDGTQLHDIRFEFNASAYVSHNYDPDSLAQRLAATCSKAPTLNQRAATFFSLGVGEDDDLKRFLYFFLALEIETHAVFGRINHAKEVTNLLAPGGATASLATTKLLANQAEGLTNLFDRFSWCAACVWKDLTDADLALFKELKSARDAIAHGRASAAPTGLSRSAELLAHRILWR